MNSTERDAYVGRCLRVAELARSNGLTLRKLDKPPVLEAAHDGKSVQFPIVTDDRLWPQTSVEEAFYSVLVDARGWAQADLSDTILVSLTDSTERSEISLMKRDRENEQERMNDLTAMLGGEQQLAALYATADLT
jgi:hypothetical protein